MEKVDIVFLACFRNRKRLTTRSFLQLRRLSKAAGLVFKFVYVDDGSSDFTSDFLLNFSEVDILTGDGSLFWSGGMSFGYKHIIKNYSFDFLVPFNDDVNFIRKNLHKILTSIHCLPPVTIFSTISRIDNSITYGGMIRRWPWHPISMRKVDSLEGLITFDSGNMNFCIIRFSVLNDIGFIDSHFIHSGGDIEFFLRCRMSNIPVVGFSIPCGYCELNPSVGTSLEDGISFFESIKRLLSIKESPFRQTLYLYRSYGGIIWPFLLFIFYFSRPVRFFFIR
jgi:GT2 family glycosyltransferase